ncbi:MAG: hypothetical protein KIT31_35965 [Deltaproteobacteria bacterium]|nr:hypothetical protein [Deltaproteobacteria bacterium]
MIGRGLFAVAAMAAGGCAWVAQGQVNKYERRVVVYEQQQPDGEALGRGDTRSTADMLQKMAEWQGYIGERDLPPVERQKLVDRLAAARVKYLLAAAQLTDTPDLGYALATRALASDNPDALAIVRRLADARGARRQELLATDRTYSLVIPGETVMATTSEGMSVRNGVVTSSHVRKELTLKAGNCVFATRPFGAEGTPNPGLTFRFVGAQPVIHARCYVNRDLAALPAREGELIVSVPGSAEFSEHVQRLPRVSAPGMKFVDFVLSGKIFDARRPFAPAMIHLAYAYTKDLVAVPDRDGVLRLRKERPEVELAGSPVFWDRDGTLPGSVATR